MRPMNDSVQSLADALGGAVRVRIHDDDLRSLTPRNVERIFHERLERLGVKFPSLNPRPPAMERPIKGRISYHRIIESNVVEAVWTPNG